VAHRLLNEPVRPKELQGQVIPISAIFGCRVIALKERMRAIEP